MKRTGLLSAASFCLCGCLTSTEGNASRVHLELSAPANMNAPAIAYKVTDRDPWTVTQAEGCITRVETKNIIARQRSPSLVLLLCIKSGLQSDSYRAFITLTPDMDQRYYNYART